MTRDGSTMLKLFKRKKIKPIDYVILVLYLVHRKGFDRISEARLHKIMYPVANKFRLKYKFAERPIPYSYNLFSDLNTMVSKGYIEAIPEVGSVLKLNYRLSLSGRAKALELLELISNEELNSIDDIVKENIT